MLYDKKLELRDGNITEIGSHKFVQNIIWLPIMYLVWWGILKKQEMSSVPKSVQAGCQYVGPSVVERA